MMADRLLRHKPTGVVYIYQPVFAMRDDFEEIIDVESRVVDEPPATKPRRTRVQPAPEQMTIPTIDDLQLGSEAARGLP
jgi:hypothetical protein